MVIFDETTDTIIVVGGTDGNYAGPAFTITFPKGWEPKRIRTVNRG